MKLDIPSITKRIKELTEGLGALPSVEASPGDVVRVEELNDATLVNEHLATGAVLLGCGVDPYGTGHYAVGFRHAKPAAGGTNPLSLELIASYSALLAVMKEIEKTELSETEFANLNDAATTAYERPLDTTVPPSAVSTEEEA